MSEYIVQKYGGSTLATTQKILAVAERIADTVSSGHTVAVVVSAMGNTTDDLIQLARSVTNGKVPSPREMDTLLSTGETVSSSLMAMALQSLGFNAVSLTGLQTGIKTDSVHMSARISSVDSNRIKTELDAGKITILAGFQGYDTNNDVTTLGRGGSDTTAVAIAIQLKAKRCEIYTDVDGIYTADPRVVQSARKMKEIDFEDMLELASLGSKMNPRSIELAAVYGMPVYVASLYSQEKGTLIHSIKKYNREKEMEIRKAVTGIALEKEVAKIKISGVVDRPGIAANLFSLMASQGISVDVIVQNTSDNHLTDITFTVSEENYERAMDVIKSKLTIKHSGVYGSKGLAKVSTVGTGMQNSTGYAATMFESLAKVNVNIDMITTSEIRITCIINRDSANDAVKALHEAFDLQTE